MTNQTCKCQHSASNHNQWNGACEYSICYCRYETFTANDSAMIEPLVVLS